MCTQDIIKFFPKTQKTEQQLELEEIRRELDAVYILIQQLLQERQRLDDMLQRLPE